MHLQPVSEQRQHPRREASLVVSYRRKYPIAVLDITHARNVSQGGMLLTTARAFGGGARLAIRARLPLRDSPRLVPGTAEAVGSREIAQRLLYETRVRIVDLDRRSFQIIGEFCALKAEPLAATGRAGRWD